ncbi:hypothetical protein PC116_g20351 [Phytophthora cactorum]|nr:hypothetical protein PC116_g20351 [Phytophthora cactorum]
MIEGPASLYSAFEIHICWNVDSNDRIDPPIQTEYLRSGGATTLTTESTANHEAYTSRRRADNVLKDGAPTVGARTDDAWLSKRSFESAW